MGVKKNFGYNLILTVCNYIFPLLTYPYVSRVLGVTNIGLCNFVDSIVNYFVLFSMLGIGSYGVREIARCKDNRIKRNEVFTNLFFINVLLTVVAVFILIICTYYISYLRSYKEFLGIGIVKIMSNLFLIEWFFQGIEQFRYITIRSVIVRSLYVIAVFLFVRSKDDVLIYYLLTTLTIVVNAYFNWNYSCRFRKLNFRAISVKTYIIPVVVFGYYRILTSMYTTFNTTFLGFSSGDIEVGYFSTATKLYTIIMGVFTAFTTVMIPRVSIMIENKDTIALQKVANQTFEALFSIAIPIIVFCIFYAPQIIFLISGVGYEGAILPFRVVIILLLVIGMEQIVVQQFLMASKSNRSIIAVCTVGATIGIVCNIVLTPRLGALGAAIAWTISEISVLLVGYKTMKKYLAVSFEMKILSRTLFSTLSYIGICCMSRVLFSTWISFVSSFIVYIIVFIILYAVVYTDNIIHSVLVSIKERSIEMLK